MRIGKLRHRVALQAVSSDQDGYGEASRVWSTYATVWAGIRTLSIEESENAQQVSGRATHEVKIRYNGNINIEDRIVFDSRVFEVVSPRNPGERNILQLLLCKEVQ